MQNLENQKVKTPKGNGIVVSDGGETVNVKLDKSEDMPNYFDRTDVSLLKEKPASKTATSKPATKAASKKPVTTVEKPASKSTKKA